jgi:hypothetical protein
MRANHIHMVTETTGDGDLTEGVVSGCDDVGKIDCGALSG